MIIYPDHARVPRGFAVLLAVVLFALIATVISVTVLFVGLDAARTSGSTQDALDAQAAANACAETALQKLVVSVSFLGTNVLSVGGASCTYTVAANGSSDLISVTGTANNATSKLSLSITLATLKVSVWQQVGDF